MNVAGNRRAELFERVENSEFDVLIIGAGINGVSTFRELALNGVSVLLVDRQDYCAGASAAPSRLIHGGIKYLENGEFRLVAESTVERNRLLHNAAHLVRPLPCTVPFYSWWGGLFNSAFKFFRLPVKGFRKRGVIVVKLGMMIYDWMGRKQRIMPTHEIRGRSDTHQLFSALDKGVIATGTYYDALVTQPERLCMELVSDTLKAARESNVACVALNYVSVSGCESGQVMLADEITDRQVRVQPKLVINAAGPWIDKVNAQLGLPTHYIGGSKGSHLILNHPELQDSLGGHMLYFETGDNRLCLAYAVGDRVLVGTTDIRVDDPDTAVCEESEVDYLFEAMAQLLPGIRISREHVVFRYSGVRPLPFDDGVGVGSVSRDHSIETDSPAADRPFHVLSLVGGKWTTFRAFGEVAADQAMQQLGYKRRSDSRDMAIGGGRDYPVAATERVLRIEQLAKEYQLSTDTVTVLFDRYGLNPGVLSAVARHPGNQPLSSIASFRIGEFHHMAENEMVEHLDDIVYRRTTLALEGRADSRVITEIADIVAPLLGWDDAVKAREIQRCEERLQASGSR